MLIVEPILAFAAMVVYLLSSFGPYINCLYRLSTSLLSRVNMTVFRTASCALMYVLLNAVTPLIASHVVARHVGFCVLAL